MKPIANAVDDLFQPRELAEDEYLNEADGLIYCSKCHTPRQHRIELKERVFLPTVRCRCQQEEYDKEEAERKHQEFLLQVSRLKANGSQDKSLHDYNFGNESLLVRTASLGRCGNWQILFRRMHCKCPVRQRCSGSDDQLFQNTEYADRNVFR